MTAPTEEISEPAEYAAYRAQVSEWYGENATLKRPDDPWATNVHVDPDAATAHFNNSRGWLGQLFEAGYSGIAWPAKYGGGGGESWMTRIEQEIAGDYEEFTGFPGATLAMLGPTLLRHGTEDQKKEFIPKLLSGELTFCQLFSEPGAGSDLASLGAKAVRDGDEFVVNGQKVWNSSAQFTDWGFLLVRTDPDAPKHKGITFILVDMSSPGIEVRPLVQMNQSAHFNEVFLNDVRIPVANVVGEINAGWAPARTVLSNESAFIAGSKVPTGEKLRELAHQVGVSDDLVFRQELARFLTVERIAGWMGEQVQQAIRRGETPPMDPGLIKLRASSNRRLAGDIALSIMGAAGQAGSTPQTAWAQAELMGRYSISIGGGTDEVLKNNIGERSLGLPREPGYDKTQAWKDVPK
ncbi:MAG: alkylation response protein AidB-like acyl-CoA dehydrogenase [Candidatus Aldehydirespiratoraceae bacterium]|jgi:alkylation response protein AidB-like acyl-CoA dehydrogenase